MTEWIFFGISAAFALIGMCAFTVAAVGIFRFRHVLYRLHAAAIADTVGVACFTISACLYLGADFVTLKELVVVGLMMFTSPVSTHLLTEIEYTMGERRAASRPDTANISDAGGEDQ